MRKSTKTICFVFHKYILKRNSIVLILIVIRFKIQVNSKRGKYIKLSTHFMRVMSEIFFLCSTNSMPFSAPVVYALCVNQSRDQKLSLLSLSVYLNVYLNLRGTILLYVSLVALCVQSHFMCPILTLCVPSNLPHFGFMRIFSFSFQFFPFSSRLKLGGFVLFGQGNIGLQKNFGSGYSRGYPLDQNS